MSRSTSRAAELVIHEYETPFSISFHSSMLIPDLSIHVSIHVSLLVSIHTKKER